MTATLDNDSQAATGGSTNSSTNNSAGSCLNSPTLSRRQTLSWAFGLTSGAVLAPLAACRGSATLAAFAALDTLPEAPRLTASGGLLSMDLTAKYAAQSLDMAVSQTMAYPGKSVKTSTTLRSFNGQYMAPTLVLTIADTLRVKLINQLPANVKGQSKLSYLNHQNSTNLHFHGLHVDPKEKNGVFGDYVVDTAEAGVLPGGTRQHQITLPPGHTNGIYWYHPHLHGSSNVQVSSGMFGAILIKDPNEKFLRPDITERIIFVHKLGLTAAGRIESFYDSLNTPASNFLLNGAYQPTLVMRPGEVQSWHFINSSSFYPFNPVMDGHTLQSYARDGNAFDGIFKPVNEGTSNQFGNQQWPGNALYPGNRLSVVIQASMSPGTYFLRSVSAPSSDSNDEIVARIVVEGAAVAAALPLASSLPRYADQKPITDAELASKGGKQRNLVLAILSKGDPLLPSPMPAGEEWAIPDGEPVRSFFYGTSFVLGNVGAGVKLAPFQSAVTTTQTVALKAVEEWTVNSLNSYPHPFHIHVNDSYVVKVNGEAVTPFWADTLPVPPQGSITFRMRFSEFTGKYVWHCHALDHEDLGMMQLVEVI